MAENFLSTENTDLLWEVLADDESVPKTRDTQETFVWLLPRFHASHQKSKIDLINLNKLFIGEMMEKLNENIFKTSPSRGNPQQLITAEDLKSDRLSEFDKEYKQKESDFQEAMKLPIPEEPNFKDDIDDKPLGDVSKEIEKMMKERNLEINNIQKEHNVKKAEQWISPSKTSLREQKDYEQNQNNNLKYIKIDKDELKLTVQSTNLDEELSPSDSVTETNIPKSVSWDDNLTINISKDSSPLPESKKNSVSIFSKLKPSNEIKTETPSESFSIQENESNHTTSPTDNQTDTEKILSFLTKRFNDLEEKIDKLIPKPHPVLMDAIDNDIVISSDED